MNRTASPDWSRLPEDVTGHAMAGPFRHTDGRQCYFHARLGRWTTDHPGDLSGESMPVGCTRNTHPIAADLMRPDLVWEERPVISMNVGDVVVWSTPNRSPVYVRITALPDAKHPRYGVFLRPGGPQFGARPEHLSPLD